MSELQPTGPRKRVVVIGGGYAGTMAANHLRLRADVDITLVNARPQFVERIRLHQLAAGTGTATADYGTLLGNGIELVVDKAEYIDADARRVQLASGAELEYDYLIYAVGSTGATPVAVPGADEYAFVLAELEGAQRLRYALADLPPNAPVTVVGGGLTGIEAAGELGEEGRAVTLVCGGILGPSLSGPGRRSVAKQLRKLGVTILETATVNEVRWDSVVLNDCAVLPSAVTVWTAGFGVPDLATRSGLRTDSIGRLLTDETLTSISDERIVGAGDAAAPSNQPLRMSCQAANPMAAQAANTVLARIAGTTPANLNQAFTGQCISVGRSYGTVQLARLDDTPIRLYIGGRTAASIKELVCKGTLWGLRKEAAKPGWYRWIKGGNRPAQLATEQQAALR
ncbi:NAD(P)/FAD-dependent oxidoreductase [Mycobacterium asiaticum]|uniref:Pyridine nucleotide-disulfide oxidoreductase n=1 Tax=Mycobacterium asiaticum TaxID=1790 RepID=A0A1A3CXF7_MYCAS|nr:FAD-dependent oxidoreductase [Mycobacterium asiaticum]OBI90751.1 pyridine nucleotide-disulfide oxidoreductase [Mycobacterium asiaticum]